MTTVVTLDSLTHVTPDGRWFDSENDASESRLLRELDEAGVSCAVVVALADYVPNEFVLKLCARHERRLIAGASFNPAAWLTAPEAAREFRRQLHAAPFRVLKLHPRFNRYDPLDPRCLAVLSELASWGTPWPVWLDSYFYFRGGTLRKPAVDTIHELVGLFPAIDFVILHAGGPQALSLREAVRDCPNAWLDLSFTLTRYEGSSVWTDLRYLVGHFDRRMMWGSDFPEVGVVESLEKFRRLAEDVPPEKTARVLGGNLAELLSRKDR